MASFQSVCVACCAYVLLTMPSLLIGFLIYLEAFFLDIRTIFAQLDRLSLFERRTSKRGNLDLQMLQRCRDAVDLHQKVNRYIVQQWILPNSRHRKYLEHSNTTLHRNVAFICWIFFWTPLITSHASGVPKCSGYSPFRSLFSTHFRLMQNLADVMNFIILMMVKPWAICECVSLLMMEKVTEMIRPFSHNFSNHQQYFSMRFSVIFNRFLWLDYINDWENLLVVWLCVSWTPKLVN